MAVAELVRNARTFSQLSRAQLAAMAGLSTTTVYRIEAGQVDPSVGTVDRILAAAGYRREDRAVPISDPSAVAAARGIIDPSSGLLSFPGARLWAERWKAAGFVAESPSGDLVADNPARLAWRAGLAAPLALRPGILRLRREGTWPDIASRVAGAGQRWAATGDMAANRIVSSADARWPVFYVEEPAEVARAAGFLPKEGAPGPSMGLLPLAGGAEVGIETDESGFAWADPVQVLIDCFGGTGRMPEQADALALALGFGRVDA